MMPLYHILINLLTIQAYSGKTVALLECAYNKWFACQMQRIESCLWVFIWYLSIFYTVQKY